MANITFDVDVEEFSTMLENMSTATDGLAKRAIYEGAKVVVQEVKSQIEGIPEDTFRHLTNGDRFEYVTDREKKGLLEGLGITKMEGDPIKGWNAKIGFDGYAEGTMKSKRYPKGRPNAMLARALETGTTVNAKYPFMRRAINRSREKAIQAMERQINEDIMSIAGK